MKHVTVACVPGGNPEKLIRIPDLTDLDRPKSSPPGARETYDHAIRTLASR